MFPEAAAANRSVFYDKSGEALGMAAVYGRLVSRHDNAAEGASTSTAWGHGLFAQKGPAGVRPETAGPVVLSSAIAARSDHAAAEATGNPAPGQTGPEQPVRKRDPDGLLRKRISFHTLFSVK